MRELLTGFAILLIIVLTTVLIAPYFVDWNGQRGFLEARLSRALGQPVTIGGNIDLRLLPTPYLVLDQVVVGDDEAPVRVGIHHLDLELSAAPLLHGEFDITEARLEEPQVRLTLQPDHTIPALPKAPAFAADVRFDRIHVSNGTLSIADPTSGHTFLFDHLDLDADAGSLSGPFKVAGREGAPGARTGFRLGTAAPEKGRSHVHFIIDETPTHAAYDFDGTVDLQGSTGEALRERFEGTAAVAGHLREGSAISIPWKLSGPFSADATRAALDGGELRLGGEDASVTLSADAKGEFDTPNMTLDLSAKQLDIDRLSGPPPDTTKPAPPPKLPDLTALRHMLAALKPPVRTALDLSIENALYGGDTLSDLQAHLGLGEETQPLRASADGPGGTHVALDGRLTTGGTPSFSGNLELTVDNLPRATAWLGAVAPSFPWKAGDMRFQTVKLVGPIKTGPDTIDSDAIALTLDRSVLKGKTHVAFGDEKHATRIAADLKADPLDFDSLPTMASLKGGESPFDLDLGLDAKAMSVARVGDGPLRTGPIKLAFVKTGQRIELKRFSADDLGGAKIEAKGSLDPRQATLALTLDATRLDRFAGLVQQLAPGDLSDKLVARAKSLAPARLEVDADLNAPASGTLKPSKLTISGVLGATKIDVAASPDGRQTPFMKVSATADAPDGAALLGQLGFTTLPGVKIGKSHVALSARGRRGDRVETTLDAALGDTKLDMTGGFDLRAKQAAGAGTLHLESPDVTPLLQSLAVAFPDMTQHVPVEVSGGIASGRAGLAFNDLKGHVAGTSLTGALAWHEVTGDKPALTGHLDVDRASLADLVGFALGAEQTPASDTAWSTRPFAHGLIDPPSGDIALEVKTFEIRPGIIATNASLALGVAPGLVTLDKVKAELNGGQATGGAKLRRNGDQATMEGKVALDHVETRLAPLSTKLTGQLDFAGNGTTSQGLVSSLAGSGEITAYDLIIEGGDPAALPKIFDDVENDILAVDEETVVRAFDDEAKGPLSAGTRRFGVSLAAGVLHLNAKDAALPEQGPVASKVDASVDLGRFTLDAAVGETLLKLPKNWSGPPPTVIVKLSGALDKPTRTYDVSSFLNALAARALAREAARVEAYEFDLRERAFFNARLQTERRREQEKRLAEDTARKAAEDKARAEAARKAPDDTATGQTDQDRTMQDQAVPPRDGTRPPWLDTAPKTQVPLQGPRRTGGRRPPGLGDVPSPPRRPAPAISDPSTFGRY